MVWLNANENPAGPPQSALAAIASGAAATARYHFEEFAKFTETLAESEGLAPEEILFGVGSGEIIDAAICAFTSTSRPLLTAVPTYEIPIELARMLGKSVVQIPLGETWEFPVARLAEEAAKNGGGLIYVCNPNNPTSSRTSKASLRWLATNLPSHTVLLVDEAYIHFVEPAEIESAIEYVKENRNVVVTRTFSKLYGMAGLRAGFACSTPELIREMTPFRNNVIPILGLRAANAALGERATLIPTRRASIARTRRDLCDWLRQKSVPYIEPYANFIMINIQRDVRSFSAEMFRRGVAVGRPFPTASQMLRVTIGTDQEMARFREVFSQVYAA
ncbi:MAG: aminotransferase class I/II-fold pyridoxal phosphate-dependent enzyme [Terriglobales bacterium]